VNIYRDSSAVVKRYAPEIGSAWMKNILTPATDKSVFMAMFAIAEIAAALNAKHRAPQGILTTERDEALVAFGLHCNREYLLIQVDRIMVDWAANLTGQYRLRGYDAIHLATGLTIHKKLISAGLSPVLFIAADKDLLAAANTEGLATDNPNNHP